MLRTKPLFGVLAFGFDPDPQSGGRPMNRTFSPWDNTPAKWLPAIALGVMCWLVIAAAIVVLGSVL